MRGGGHRTRGLRGDIPTSFLMRPSSIVDYIAMKRCSIVLPACCPSVRAARYKQRVCDSVCAGRHLIPVPCMERTVPGRSVPLLASPNQAMRPLYHVSCERWTVERRAHA